ncbi:hypothetical protein M5D96_014149, partial [Drosophila gunungcola]
MQFVQTNSNLTARQKLLTWDLKKVLLCQFYHNMPGSSNKSQKLVG